MKKSILFLLTCSFCLTAFTQCEISKEDFTIEEHETLTEGEILSLKYLREEEFLAGDVYEYLSGLYSVPVFKNISKSEDVHTERVRELLELYSIEDPAANHEAGKFVDPELQELYDALILKGKMSLDSSIIVGLIIEEKDIMDLNHALHEVIQSENIKQVYSFLLMGSHHHLKAFNFQAENRKLVYVPQFLSMEEFREALNN